MSQTAYGQTDALALAVVDFLNTTSASLCVPIAAERRFAPVTDLKLIPDASSPASVDVFPDVESTKRTGFSTFESEYAIHVYIQQLTAETDEEAQCALLCQLRAQIIEALKPQRLALLNAVHPLAQGSVIMLRAHSADRNPENPAGLYSLARLLQMHVFESDTIIIFKAAA